MPRLQWGIARVWLLAAPIFALQLAAHSAPTVSLTSPANGANLPAPVSLTLVANAADADSTITSVSFYQGSTLLGTSTNAPYSFTWNNVPAASYTLTAAATNALGATTTSSSVALNVTGGNGPINYVYDELNRLVGISDAASNSATYTYDAVGNILSISRTTASQVSLSEFTPNSGAAGTTVTIYGSGFSPTASQNTVTFNQVAATVTSATATQLVVVVPSGAGTGTISVTTPIGSATSASPFTVAATPNAPTIASFTPTIGDVGTVVTINGANFSAMASNNKVEFNNRIAKVSPASATSIAAQVLDSISSGKISVTTPRGRAVSTDDFFVPPQDYLASDIDVTGRMGIGESKTITITTPDKNGLILFDGSAGQQVSLSLNGVTISNLYISMLAPDGHWLDCSIRGANDAFCSQYLPVTGTYTILIESRTSGSATVTLNEIHDVAASITIDGPAVTVATTAPGQGANLTFSGTAGQLVSLAISGVSLTGNDVAKVNILKPNGVSYGSGSSVPPYDFIGPLNLPVTGNYIIRFQPQHYSATGSGTLQLYSSPDVDGGSLTVDGPAVTVTTVAPGQLVYFSSSGTKDQRVALDVSGVTLSNGGVADVFALTPDGFSLLNRSPVSSSGFTRVMGIPSTGEYKVYFDPVGAAIGSATFRLYNAPNIVSGIVIGAPPSTVTLIPGQNASLSFSGTAGQQVTVRLSGNTIGCPFVYLLQPGGGVIAQNFACTESFNVTQTLPVTDTYSIVINSFDTAGSINVAVTSP